VGVGGICVAVGALVGVLSSTVGVASDGSAVAVGSLVAVGSGDGVGVMVMMASCCADMVEVGRKA